MPAYPSGHQHHLQSAIRSGLVLDPGLGLGRSCKAGLRLLSGLRLGWETRSDNGG